MLMTDHTIVMDWFQLLNKVGGQVPCQKVLMKRAQGGGAHLSMALNQWCKFHIPMIGDSYPRNRC